ncbi:hypothetical protein [Crateriforma conspicua]|nr:hypothetical protein [Crateriforma conspicua]
MRRSVWGGGYCRGNRRLMGMPNAGTAMRHLFYWCFIFGFIACMMLTP